MKKNIQGVEEKQSAKGTYLKVTWDDGKADNVFKKEHIDVIRVAQKDNLTVEVTKEKQGQYWNVTNVVLPSPFTEKTSATSTLPGVPAKSSVPEKEEFKPIRADSTNRSDALSYAVQLVTLGKVGIDQLFIEADKCLEYINKK